MATWVLAALADHPAFMFVWRRRLQEDPKKYFAFTWYIFMNPRPQGMMLFPLAYTSLQVAESCVGNADGPVHAFNKSSNA